MGNCNCFERERARVTAWGGEDGQDDEENDGEGGNNGSAPSTTRLKIRMTKGQLRRLLDGAGRGSAVEDVVAEIMSMGDVHVEPVEAEGHRPPPKLGTIQEDDLDEY